MSDLTIFLILFILPIFLIFSIAYIASKSRQKKQNTLLDNVPINASMKVILRYNFGQSQDKFIKMKAFQGSGVLYVLDNQIHFRTRSR